MFSAKLTCELSVSSKCWLNFFLPYPQAHLQNLHLIMELLYWLSEGGDSEDREHVTLVLKDESKILEETKFILFLSVREASVFSCHVATWNIQIQLSVFGISRGPFNLDAEDMEQSSTQEV